jgi:hypothetical protein
MPLRYAIDKRLRLIVTLGEGSVTFEEVRGHQDRLLSDPDFDGAFNQLIDVTAATQLDVSSDEAIIIADRRIVNATSRRAFVANQPHIYGFGRLMAAHHDAKAIVNVFYNRDEALAWLGIDESVPAYEWK